MMATESDPPAIDPTELERLADRIATCHSDDEETQAGLRTVNLMLLKHLMAGTPDERRAAQRVMDTGRARVG